MARGRHHISHINEGNFTQLWSQCMCIHRYAD